MTYQTVPYNAFLRQTLARLADPGLFLVSQGQDGRTNAMAIGWGTIGIIWGKPMFLVLVRPSRFTYSLLEQSDSFTVCVPAPSQYDALLYCGNHSGRDEDKLAVCGLETVPSLRVRTPGLAGTPLIYECQIVHHNDILAGNLQESIITEYYPQDNYHRVYFGEILAVRALPDAESLLEPARR